MPRRTPLPGRLPLSLSAAALTGLIATTALVAVGLQAQASVPAGPRPSATPPVAPATLPADPATPASDVPAGAVDAPCPSGVTVHAAEELQAALTAATPGRVIVLAPGRYEGRFEVAASGTAQAPITLCGPRDAVLDGGDTSHGTVLRFDHVGFWRVQGFTVTNGQKGVMADGVTSSLFTGLTVTHIGDEAIHLRRNSTDNRVIHNTVSHTGLFNRAYGEGIYIGSAAANWDSNTGGAPDRSDRNVIQANRLSDTHAEAVDIKEGTNDGVVADNLVEALGTDTTDSSIDVKGDGWTLTGNTLKNVPAHGFQSHEIRPGWGDRNVFRGNKVTSSRARWGYAIDLRPALANAVGCDNTAGPGLQLASVPCR